MYYIWSKIKTFLNLKVKPIMNTLLKIKFSTSSVNGLWNWGTLEVLNDTDLILNNQGDR